MDEGRVEEGEAQCEQQIPKSRVGRRGGRGGIQGTSRRRIEGVMEEGEARPNVGTGGSRGGIQGQEVAATSAWRRAAARDPNTFPIREARALSSFFTIA